MANQVDCKHETKGAGWDFQIWGFGVVRCLDCGYEYTQDSCKHESAIFTPRGVVVCALCGFEHPEVVQITWRAALQHSNGITEMFLDGYMPIYSAPIGIFADTT